MRRETLSPELPSRTVVSTLPPHCSEPNPACLGPHTALSSSRRAAHLVASAFARQDQEGGRGGRTVGHHLVFVVAHLASFSLSSL